MHSKPKIGILALTLEFYEQFGPELRLSREKWLRENAVPVLEKFADVEFEKAVYAAEDIAGAVSQLESGGCDILLVVCLTYSPSGNILPALEKTSLPIFVWNTQELWAVDENYGPEQLGANHGVHGTQDLCSVLLRSGVKFEYHTSHLNDNDATGKIEDVAISAAMVSRLKASRVGIIGYPFPGMDDFKVDADYLKESLGVTREEISVDEFINEAGKINTDEIATLVGQYKDSYQVAEGITQAQLQVSAKYELAVRKIVSDRSLDALTYQFLAFGDDKRSETLPFVAASRMMADGIGFAGEGDIVGAIATWFLNGLCMPATFSEIFTTDFGGNSVLMSHMGEANVAMARKYKPVKLSARESNIVPTIQRQIALETVIQPGPATLVALVQGPANKWRFVVSEMEVVEFGPLDTGLAVPHFKLAPVDGDIRYWLTAYAKAGGPHHNAMCFGDARDRLKFAADLLGADYIEV